ncbi:MAG: hypothetical protein AAF456_18255 [Planctomycetota bacterium]
MKFESATLSGSESGSNPQTSPEEYGNSPRLPGIVATLLLLTIAGVCGYFVWRTVNPPQPQYDFAARVVCSFETGSKEQVEEEVTRPLLNALRSVEEIELVVTHSFEGDALLHIRGYSGSDPDEIIGKITESVGSVSLPSFADQPTVEVVAAESEFTDYKRYQRVWLTMLKDENEEQRFRDEGPSEETLKARESILKSIERRVVIQLWRNDGMEIIVDVPPEYGLENLHIKHGEGVAQIRHLARVVHSEWPIRTEYEF